MTAAASAAHGGIIAPPDSHWLSIGDSGAIILCAQCEMPGYPMDVREEYMGANTLHGIGRCVHCGRDLLLWERVALADPAR